MVPAPITPIGLQSRVRVAESTDVNNRGSSRREPVATSEERRLPMFAETAISPAFSAIAPARHWARDRLTEAGLSDGRLDTAVLLVSELVTNAVAHAHPPVVLRVHVDEERTRVEVTDGAQQLPVALDP